MIYGSVCSGIEAATVAWHPLGWEASFYSEIDKFPREVLSHHYPKTPLHGDFTTIQKDDYEPIELLVGGTPCQSFSIAGLREGLADPRGNLMLEFGALANRLRPTWLVWENVPGVLSSNSGKDFASFLAMLGELGYGFAYRVLDAQYFGVPQRRRRVFVVGHLGSWQRAAAVLFEQHSLQGHPAPRRGEGQEVAGTLTRGFGDRGLDLDQIAGGGYAINTIAAEGETSGSCLARDYKGFANQDLESGRNLAITYALAGNTIGREPQNGGNGDGWGEDVSYTLTKTDQHGVAVFDQAQITSATNRSRVEYGQPAPTMSKNSSLHSINSMQVRRLTPLECERLQGFPDNYTNIPKASDSSRYKALGNSMAVPVMRWIGSRIAMVDAIISPSSEEGA